MSWTITAYIGGSLIAFATVLAVREHVWLRSAHVADGTVIELITKRGSRGRTVHAPRVRYRTADGSEHEFTRGWYSHPVGFAVGDRVAVSYDPTTSEARMLAFGQRFGVAAVIASVGLGLLCMGSSFIYGRTCVPRIYQERTALPFANDRSA